jgi:hypothetical protein
MAFLRLRVQIRGGYGDSSPQEPVMPQSEGQKRKVEKVMHEYKEGDLKSSSGDKVKSRKQAVAIAISEADVPKKGSKKTKH